MSLDELRAKLAKAKETKIELSADDREEAALRAELDRERERVIRERAETRKLAADRVCDDARKEWGERFRCIDFEATSPGLGAWILVPNKAASQAFRKLAAEDSKISDADTRNNIAAHIFAIVVQKEDGACEVLRGAVAGQTAHKAFEEYTFADGQCQIAIVELNGMAATAAAKKS